MKGIDLNGSYKLNYFTHGQDMGELLKETFTPDGWLETLVPEDVKTALRRAGLITGEYYGKDMERERFIEESDWVYHRLFYVEETLKQGRNILRFDGIDTLAEIFLNGRLLGSSSNMFVPWEFDVSGELRYGGVNTLIIRIASSTRSVEEISRTGLYPAEETDRLLLRKSQMNYGWDFCARSLSVGIWKKAAILHKEEAALGEYYLYTREADQETAKLSLSVRIDVPGQDDGLTWEFGLYLKGKPVYRTTGTGEEPVLFEIAAPKLWWPRPYGEPVLYDVVLLLKREGEILDRKEAKFGIRSVRLLQERLPEGGREFQIEVNHRRLFIRGANWVPINAVYGEIKECEYAFYLRRAADANLSMLRVWGGGIYEPDLFFELCDREGIMVFQDFMFACGVFPQDEEFLRLAEQEAAYIIKSYRNHTSLVLWSGDNEVDQFYRWFAPDRSYEDNQLTRRIIREALHKFDPVRPYLVSSPLSPYPEEEGGEDPNSPHQGDMHVYYGSLDPASPVYYKKIREIVPRFMSEFGFSSLPCEQTFHRFNFRKEELRLGKDPWLDQHKAFEGFIKRGETGEMIYYSQYVQAYGLKYWMEYMRSRKGICGGMLYWKFNDPIASNRPNMLFPTMMSVIDFYGRPKAAYYYTRRAYEDRILAFREDCTGGVGVFFCNELEEAYEGLLEISLLDFNGKVLEHEERNCLAHGDAATCLGELPMEKYGSYLRDSCYVRVKFVGPGCVIVNRYLLFELGECFHVGLPLANITVTSMSLTGAALEITVTADVYVQDLVLELMDTDALYSDNYLCMDAGETRRLTVTVPERAFPEHPCLKLEARNAGRRLYYLPE